MAPLGDSLDRNHEAVPASADVPPAGAEAQPWRPNSPPLSDGGQAPPPSPPAGARRRCAPPRRRRRLSGCAIAAIVILGIGLLLAVAFLAVLGELGDTLMTEAGDYPAGVDGAIRKEVIVRGIGDTEDEIAVVDVKGLIVAEAPFDHASTKTIVKQLKAARDDGNVVAVILDMNTPGGEVTASDEIHRAVRQVVENGKPVVTCMHAVGASGGYFIAAASDYVVANRLTLTGSIGVMLGTLNYAGLFEKWGLESEVYQSGSLKALLHGGRERTDEERRLVQELVDYNFVEFARIVADGRSRFESVEDVLNAEFADGRVLTGKQAHEAGLVDQLGYFEDAVSKTRDLAAAPHAKVVRYKRALRLTDLLLTMQHRQPAGLVEHVLPPASRAIKPGRLYFLMTDAVP